MSVFRRLLVIFFALPAAFTLKGQQADSALVVAQPLAAPDSTKVFYFFHHGIDSVGNRDHIHVDTLINTVRYYDPARERQNFFSVLGNIGLAHQSMVFAPRIHTGFDHGIHAFDGYLYTHDNIRYYSSVAPYTRLKYVTGSRKEQFFHVTHSHTIKRQLTIAADFRIINSSGKPYWRQKSDDINTAATAYYNTKNGRYGVYAHYYYNRLKCMENGGLINDTAYEQYRAGRNSSQFDYWLKNALSTLKENAWFMKHFVDLDFRKPDSLETGRKQGFSLGKLTLTTAYNKSRFIYTDQDALSGYFPAVYIDTAGTADSLYFKRLDNTLNWASNEERADGTPAKFRFFAGFHHAYIEAHEPDRKTYLNQYTPSAGFIMWWIKQLSLSSSFEYVIGDHNGGDFRVNALLSFSPGNSGRAGTLSLDGSFARIAPSWSAVHFYSNYFQWVNSGFTKQQVTAVTIRYTLRQLEAGINWYNLDNYVFWNQYAYPEQVWDRSLNVYSLYVNKDFVFGSFRIDNRAVLQLSDDERISLPLFAARQSYYFTFDLFKKALRMQAGIDAFYNTSYYADAWMPASRQFFIQDQRKTGNYIYLDVFLNFRIKRAKLFLALDHFNSGLFGYRYYGVPHYPAADRSFRFGVSWAFHD